MGNDISNLKFEFLNFLKKNDIILEENQEKALACLHEEINKVWNYIIGNLEYISLLKDDDDILENLSNRFDKFSKILNKSNLFSCMLGCHFTSNQDYELSIKSTQRNLKSIKVSENFSDIIDALLNHSKKFCVNDNKLVKTEGCILKYFANFLAIIQTKISSVISDLNIENLDINNEKKEKHLTLVSENLKKFCPDKYELLKKQGVFGPALSEASIENLSVFNFDSKGNIILNSKSFTQGIIKNCYFISALRSLSNNSKASVYIRNCFDKMSDSDLKFSNEKTSAEKLKKKFTIGFFNVDYNSLSVDELTHLGTMNKTACILKCLNSKTYYNVTCAELMASGIELKGNELWPLLIEHAWGNHLVHESKSLGKIKEKLPFEYKKIKNTDSFFPEVVKITGEKSVLSRFATNMYNSIALATLTGKTVHVSCPDLSTGSSDERLLKLLLGLKDKKLMTVFKGRESNSGNRRTSTKFIDPCTKKSFMLFSGHAVSVKDCLAMGGTYIVQLHDTMNSIGDDGIFHMTLSDFKKEFDNIIST